MGTELKKVLDKKIRNIFYCENQDKGGEILYKLSQIVSFTRVYSTLECLFPTNILEQKVSEDLWIVRKTLLRPRFIKEDWFTTDIF